MSRLFSLVGRFLFLTLFACLNLNIGRCARMRLTDGTTQGNNSAGFFPVCGEAPLFKQPKINNIKMTYKTKSIHRNSKDFIAGGFDVYPGMFPQVVTIFANNEEFCNGVLVTDQHILTAAHCLINSTDNSFLKPSEMTVDFGSEKPYKNPRNVSLICRSRETQVPAKMINDFAVMKLTDKVEFSDFIQPACAPTSGLKYRHVCYTLGSGVLHAVGDDLRPSNFMRAIPTRFVKECPQAEREDKSRACVISKIEPFKGDTCKGDSGGPVLCHFKDAWRLYGITSYGAPECRAGKESIGFVVNVSMKFKSINHLVQVCNKKSP